MNEIYAGAKCAETNGTASSSAIQFALLHGLLALVAIPFHYKSKPSVFEFGVIESQRKETHHSSTAASSTPHKTNGTTRAGSFPCHTQPSLQS